MKKYFFILWNLVITGLLILLGFLVFSLHRIGFSNLLIILGCFYIFNLFFSMFLLLQERRAIVKISWMIIIALVPFLGYLIFIIFGQKYRNRISVYQYQQRSWFQHEELDKNTSNHVFNKQSSISKRGIYDANFELIPLNIGSYERIFQDIKQAKKNIYIQFYIIKPGEIYQQFKKILIEKANQGVNVKLIVDDFGRWALPWHEINQLKDEGLEIGIFSRVHFPFVGSNNGYRTHRKMVIIDNEILYTGGINIGPEYANNDKKYGLWLDAQFKIIGPLINSYLLLFANDWEQITNQKLIIEKNVIQKFSNLDFQSKGIMVEDSPEIKEFILENSIVKWIFQAKKEIKITTPYFIPTQAILNALKIASKAGVKVTIFFPGRPDKKIVLVASKFWAKELIPYGVEFKMTDDILIHSKLAVFDNEYAYLGTANLDIRSLSSQFEFLNLVSGQIVEDINKEFARYEKLSKKWEPPKESKSIVIRNVKKFFIRLFAYVFSPLM